MVTLLWKKGNRGMAITGSCLSTMERAVVFGSPQRLDLKLYCIPAEDTLDIWPALPLIIEGAIFFPSGDNFVALEQCDRVCEVDLRFMSWELEEVLTPMQVPFPGLAYLRLQSYSKTPPVIPD